VKLVNSYGNEIELDERFDIEHIRTLIDSKNNKGIDKYLKSVPSFPSHRFGGVSIRIDKSGVYVGGIKSPIKAEKGIILKANKSKNTNIEKKTNLNKNHTNVWTLIPFSRGSEWISLVPFSRKNRRHLKYFTRGSEWVSLIPFSRENRWHLKYFTRGSEWILK
jgi:hypothetical protein